MHKQAIDELLIKRTEDLIKAKNDGVKIVGYFPGDYVPEELIYASGAIPLCLTDGGNIQTADSALSILPGVICPFARAQIGEMMLLKSPFYKMIDFIIAPITCQHLKKVAEILEFRGDIKIFKLGIPHFSEDGSEVEYYANRLRILRERLQEHTGKDTSDEKINEAIALYNRMRELFRKISLLRRSPSPPFSILEFVRLNHASFYADPYLMVDMLDSLYKDWRGSNDIQKSGKPRLLLVGPNLARGDYKILELIEDAGGEIVIEEICEGIRYYWRQIEKSSDPIQSLATGYLKNRIPCAFMRQSTSKRFDFTVQLISDFKVSGVIWYELLCCETYDQEAYFFEKKLRERNMPMIIVESNYDASELGPLKTRVEAFIEMTQGGPLYA